MAISYNTRHPKLCHVDEWEAEYLLIAENTERRGEAETDPIKKARIANFLKEYWGVNHGMNRYTMSGHNGQSRTTKDQVIFFDVF